MNDIDDDLQRALDYALARADLPTRSETPDDYAARLVPLMHESGYLSARLEPRAEGLVGALEPLTWGHVFPNDKATSRDLTVFAMTIGYLKRHLHERLAAAPPAPAPLDFECADPTCEGGHCKHRVGAWLARPEPRAEGLREAALDVAARFHRVMNQPEGVWEIDDEAAVERLAALAATPPAPAPLEHSNEWWRRAVGLDAPEQPECRCTAIATSGHYRTCPEFAG